MPNPIDVEALRLHALYRGKIQTSPKVPIRDATDFSYWYTPGVAAPCRAIEADPEKAWELTNKANTIAIVSDGTRVLGLGNIGPLAGLPVMEGKALLFKYLGGVDAVPLCLASADTRELIRAVQILAPSFGAVNLEDIAQPRCFRVLAALRESLPIPVWHDDQQGTATAVLAALTNAAKVVAKPLRSLRIAMIGMGAANVATYHLLKVAGIDPGQIVACDSRGILHRGRGDEQDLRNHFPEKWRVCEESNPDRRTGNIPQALAGADVCIAFSTPGPDTIPTADIQAMAKDAIVFACANPVPEIAPADARAAGARVVATGRGDFPNQLNNGLVFPGLFRGILDARATAITDEIALAVAAELARAAELRGLNEEHILPPMTDWLTVPRLAAAAAVTAQERGLSKSRLTGDDYIQLATHRILEAQKHTMRE